MMIDPPIVDSCSASDVARGVARLFHRQGLMIMSEVPLPNGRRADMVAIDPRGLITIVEIKVARADLLGDAKWPEYLEWCDQFSWALSPGLDASVLNSEDRQPERCGVIVADRYDAAIIREAAHVPVAPARRRAELLRLGRLAMRRLMQVADPELALHAGERDIGS